MKAINIARLAACTASCIFVSVGVITYKQRLIVAGRQRMLEKRYPEKHIAQTLANRPPPAIGGQGHSQQSESRQDKGASRWTPPMLSQSEKREYQRRVSSGLLPTSNQIRLLSERIKVRLQYHELYWDLGLTKEQIDKFEIRLASAGGVHLIESAITPVPNGETSFRMAQLRKQDEIVKETLGEEYVEAFRTYSASARVREVLNDAIVGNFSTDSVLTASQAKTLLNLCMGAATKVNEPILNPADINWNEVCEQASSFLTPTQVSTLRDVIAVRKFATIFSQLTGLPRRSPVRGI